MWRPFQPALTPQQVAGSLHFLVVDAARHDAEPGQMGFPLKKPPTPALFVQNRRYHEAATLLMLQAKAHDAPAWKTVMDGYLMILADNPGPAAHEALRLAVERLSLILRMTDNNADLAWVQEWGFSWLTDAGHGDEDNWVTQGLVVTKWEMRLAMLATVTKATRLAS